MWRVLMALGPTMHSAWIPDAEQLAGVLEGLSVAGARGEC